LVELLEGVVQHGQIHHRVVG
jgi:hypothetical protein